MYSLDGILRYIRLCIGLCKLANMLGQMIDANSLAGVAPLKRLTSFYFSVRPNMHAYSAELLSLGLLKNIAKLFTRITQVTLTRWGRVLASRLPLSIKSPWAL